MTSVRVLAVTLLLTCVILAVSAKPLDLSDDVHPEPRLLGSLLSKPKKAASKLSPFKLSGTLTLPGSADLLGMANSAFKTATTALHLVDLNKLAGLLAKVAKKAAKRDEFAEAVVAAKNVLLHAGLEVTKNVQAYLQA